MTLLTLAALTGCSDNDGLTVSDDRPVVAALSLSVLPRTGGATRMSGDVVQATSGTFRGLQSLRAIPFATQGKITINDRPKAYDTQGLRSEEYQKTSTSFYYFETCSFTAGVSSFLVYGRAQTAVGTDGLPQDKPRNGSLVATFLGDGSPAGISFTLDPIWDSTEVPADGIVMEDCLTDIANARVSYQGYIYNWRNAPDTKLRAFYLNFTGQGSQNNALIAASTANVQRHLSDLRVKIAALTFAAGTIDALLCQAIIDAIDKNLALLPADYPASVHLPDGAAVVRWNGTGFQTETTTTTLANISSLRRYAYPAELYYFANSRIKTTTRDDRRNYYSSESSWDNLLNQYEYDNGTVTNNTTAVAIKEPLQYAVGCLQLSFKSFSGTLDDADGNAVPCNSTSFPLTGIIVGSQRPVGFDFVPTTASDVDTHFIYDSNPVATNGQQLYLGQPGASTTNTLVLQTCDDETVTLILEFQNNSGLAFTGLNGVVYPGTRFYLTGSVEPKTVPQADYEKRAFTRDFTTHVGITAASLAKAYNVTPDILTPHLEIGVSLTPQWTMATPANVRLD